MNNSDATETRARGTSGSPGGSAVGWWKRAHCRGADIENFFPLPNDQDTIERALEMCGQCPVRNPCRRYAISHSERYGIWGGLTEATREALMRTASVHRRPRKAAEPGSTTGAAEIPALGGLRPS